MEARSPDGATLPAGEAGEIVYTGPNVMMGYAESRADLGLGDTHGDTLETGDLGYLDDEGFLFLTGRSKRIAKIAGLRISLDEVEAMAPELQSHAVEAPAGTITLTTLVSESDGDGHTRAARELAEIAPRTAQAVAHPPHRRSSAAAQRQGGLPSTRGAGRAAMMDRMPTTGRGPMSLEQLFDAEQFTLPQDVKESLLLDELTALTDHHIRRSPAYARIAAHTAPAPTLDCRTCPTCPCRCSSRTPCAAWTNPEVFKG